jgi:hypothetical protein
MSITEPPDDRFDAAEAEVERGEPWRFRDTATPNPITLKASTPECWHRGHTRHGEADFLSGVDREGKPWSILVGSTVLRKRLLEGLVEEWNMEKGLFEVVETLGPVQPGEVFSIKYIGDGENTQGQPYPRFVVSRKPVKVQEGDDDAIPF